MLQRIERGLRRRIEVEYKLVRRNRFAVGVQQRRLLRVETAIRNVVKQIEQVEIHMPQDLVGDHGVGRGNASPQFDNRGFLMRGNDKAVVGFEHCQPVHRRQLPKHQITDLHSARPRVLGDDVLLRSHDIAQGH